MLRDWFFCGDALVNRIIKNPIKWTYKIFAEKWPYLELVVELRCLCLFSTQNQVWILRNGVWWPSFSFSSVPVPCRSLPAWDHCSKLPAFLPISFYSHSVCFVSVFPFRSLLHQWNYSAANMSPTSRCLPPPPPPLVFPRGPLFFSLVPATASFPINPL